jgi:hypothetical protein
VIRKQDYQLTSNIYTNLFHYTTGYLEKCNRNSKDFRHSSGLMVWFAYHVLLIFNYKRTSPKGNFFMILSQMHIQRKFLSLHVVCGFPFLDCMLVFSLCCYFRSFDLKASNQTLKTKLSSIFSTTKIIQLNFFNIASLAPFLKDDKI